MAQESLLPIGLLNRLQRLYGNYSGLRRRSKLLFVDRANYSGVSGFRSIVEVLEKAGIQIGHLLERELFIRIYRFLATRHTLNSIDWDQYETDSIFQLVFPQPGMIRPGVVRAYLDAETDPEREQIVREAMRESNPHDGGQQLNKPWFKSEEGELEVLDGSQHKYPQTQLIFDQTTQNCFSFCTYCFRHAQVRGDEDMFVQRDIGQVHAYLRQHQEVNDLLITGGDAGFMPAERFEQFIEPILEDPDLDHVKTIRLGTRALTYDPEIVLTHKYDTMLKLFDRLYNHGVQLAWMAHFSTPRELLNPATIGAIRRLQSHHAVIRSQSPIMKHISLFRDQQGGIDIARSARNWIDLGNLLGMLCIGFHSMYCARPTGEHHYFTAPLADILKVFDTIYRSLSSINRPSRHISMTTSAGKISILGTAQVHGETAFAMKFTEARDMQWIDRVFLAKYDTKTNNVALLVPFDTDEFFFQRQLHQIEQELTQTLAEMVEG
jgi:lysine 2,3-aminomutase